MDSLKEISLIFCGDKGNFYKYKSGPQLVTFFNDYLLTHNEYGQGFPSRWVYVKEKLGEIINNDEINIFLDFILGKQFLIKEWGCTEVEAIEKAEKIRSEFNRILACDKYLISHKDGKFILTKQEDDFNLIGTGGYSTVYYQKSTGYAVKILKEEFVVDKGIRSRFKREFEITKSLQDIEGIIKVYSFDEGKCSYSMEYIEKTLEKYVLSEKINNEIKQKYICQILNTMSEVHKRDVIHRDLSPNNILIVDDLVKITDFGLGKNLNVLASHQTMNTNSAGQYYYCAPEQFRKLKEADKRSDVYSIGRVINYIMTGDPTNSHHLYGNVCNKATNNEATNRYRDAQELTKQFEFVVKYNQQKTREPVVRRKINDRIYDLDVEEYIYNMSAEDVSKTISQGIPAFVDAVVWFMGMSEENAQYIIQNIESTYKNACNWSYEANDPFAELAEKVIRGQFDFTVKETAAHILNHIAWDVNRFSAQHKVRRIIQDGVDPLIEEIIKKK